MSGTVVTTPRPSRVPRDGGAPAAAPAPAPAPHERAGAPLSTDETADFLCATGIRKAWSDAVVLDGVSLGVRRGEFVTILGPSGCGKTTLLRIIAGLEHADAGDVVIDGQTVTRWPAARRGCGIVFQSYALFPNLNALQNVAFGIPRRGTRRQQRLQRATELLALVGLAEHGRKRPAQLSGGQQQRVALARALATSPRLLLLDEPLSALDAKVRARLRGELRTLQRRLGLSTVMVTHDQEEALSMADRVVVMDHGRVVQADPPRRVYDRPASAFVAGFVGAMNFLDGWHRLGPGLFTRDGRRLRCAHPPTVEPAHDHDHHAPATLAIRPEQVGLTDTDRDNALPVRVESVEFRGAFCRVHARPLLDDGLTTPPPLMIDLNAHLTDAATCQPGDARFAHLPPEALRVFPPGASAAS